MALTGRDRASAAPVGAKDVAARAGVSPATVSRVLTGNSRVNADKRAAVLKACEELGFVPNGAARALSSRKSMAIGAVVPNVANRTFALAMSAFQDRIKQAGYTLLLTTSGYDAETERREVMLLLERGIDGLMLVGGLHHPSLYEQVGRLSVPLVQTWTLSAEHPCVGFDNAAAVRRATNYLIDLGHRRIGIITGPRADNDRAPARVLGMREAMAARGLDVDDAHDIEKPHGIGAGRDAMRELLARAGRPTAVICGNDEIAFGALIEAQHEGLTVPDDISIVGFDDSDFAAHLKPALTTVRISAEQIGRVAGDYLVQAISGLPAPRRTEIDADLIVRGSTAPPRS